MDTADQTSGDEKNNAQSKLGTWGGSKPPGISPRKTTTGSVTVT